VPSLPIRDAHELLIHQCWNELPEEDKFDRTFASESALWPFMLAKER
jgi:hypothetical protein